MTFKRVPLSVSLAFLLCHSAYAEDLQSARQKALKNLDFVVPAVPAFTVLGVSPSQVSRPGAPRAFAAALANGLSPSGGIQNGLAVEVSPLDLAGKKLPFFDAFRFSAATNVTVNEGVTTSQLSGAFRWSLNGSDMSGTDLDLCLQNALPLPKPPQPPLSEPTKDPNALVDVKRIEALEQTDFELLNKVQRLEEAQASALSAEKQNDSLKRCRNAFRNALLATQSFEIAGAVIGSSVNDPRINKLQFAQASLWLSGGFGFNSITEELQQKLDVLKANRADPTWNEKMLAPLLEKNHFGFEPLLFIRFDARKSAADSSMGEKDLSVLARLPLFWERTGVFFEGGIKLADITNANGSTRIKAPLGIGSDFRIADGTWVGLYFGGDAATKEFLTVTNLKWAFGDSRPFIY